MMSFETGTKVRIKNSPMAVGWSVAGRTGTVVGPDPNHLIKNPNVVSIVLDGEIPKSLFPSKGIHVSHLEEIKGE